ncbi:cilia- and flagella-associated protein 161-like [Lissotriton helveticus]
MTGPITQGKKQEGRTIPTDSRNKRGEDDNQETNLHGEKEQQNFPRLNQGNSGLLVEYLLKACILLPSTYIITSIDGSPQGDVLRYGQNFALRTTDDFTGHLYLASDQKTFVKCARKFRMQEVFLTAEPSYLTCWQTSYFDPQMRMEFEGEPVPANIKLLIIHSKTNQYLAVLRKCVSLTCFEKEYEATARTFLDAHKAEETVNHWIIITGDPGNEKLCMFTRPEVPFEKSEENEKQESSDQSSKPLCTDKTQSSGS